MMRPGCRWTRQSQPRIAAASWSSVHAVRLPRLLTERISTKRGHGLRARDGADPVGG